MPRKSTAKSLTIPPPVNGWNTRDPISDMDQTYAVEIENFFPGAGTVDLRNGSRYHSKSIGSGNVVTLAALEYGTTNKLIAVGASSAKVYDATTASSAATDIHGAAAAFSNSICTTLQFRDRLFLKPLHVNDDVYHYTGTGNIALSAFTGPSGDDKLLYAMGAYKSRIYFSGWYTSSIWYGGVDSITGALTEFDLTSVFSRGNELILFVGAVTRAKQAAEEDLFCVINSFGEVLIYQGDYPGSSTWALIGRYQIPRPAGVKSFFYAGSSLHVITRLGVVAIRDLLSGANDKTFPMITDIIGQAFIDNFIDSVVNLAANSYIHTGVIYPRGKFIMINCYNGTNIIQFVQNVETKAWTKFSGLSAYSMAMFGDRLYVGSTNGRVMKLDEGYYDEDPANEGSILTRNIKLRPAYNYFGDRESKKQFTEATPIIYQSEGLSLTMDSDIDFGNVTATSTVTDTSDTAYKLYRPKMGLNGIGDCASIRIDGSATTKRISLQAIKVNWNEGDIQ